MQFAYSTLACPDWSVEQMISAAQDYGYSALELRLLDGEVLEPVRDRALIDRATSLARAAGIEICAIDTSCRLYYRSPEDEEKYGAELRDWIALANDLKIPLLRVVCGPTEVEGQLAPDDETVDSQVAARLGAAAPDAERAGVILGLETHDTYSSAMRVANVLRQVSSSAVGAVWDSLHPHRMGESPAQVLEALGPWLVHTHIKDAYRLDPEGRRWQQVLLGEGEVPLREIVDLLQQHGYNGLFSAEWEKKWVSSLAEPEVALPQHINWLRDTLQS